MDNNSTQDDHKVIATKISIPTFRRLTKILHRVGVTSYTLMQNFIDVFIRYGDDRHNLTPEMEELMTAFEHCDGWDKQFNLADPDARPQITEATYYLRDKEKRGVRVVHVELPFFGHWSQTWNIQMILEKFLCLTFPSLYKRLRALAVVRDCTSILELLIQVVNEYESEENKAELRRPFEDAERSEWGRKPHTQPYKIKHRHTVDEMDSPDLFGNDNDTFLENEHEQ